MKKDWFREFKNPGADFRLAPFWFWNHRLEKDELIRQIRMMKDREIGGIVLHARHGLKTPYLSKEWMECVGWAVEEAERNGMIVWLYDEENWPSGAAGGKILADYPHYRMSQMYLANEFNVSGRCAKKIPGDDEILFVLACPLRKNKLAGIPGEVVDLTGRVKNRRFDWTAPAGTWKVMVVCRSFNPGYFHGGYLDTLNKKAVGEFINRTHEQYRRRFGRKFGKTIRGIFTDEPAGFYFSGNFKCIRKRELPFTGNLFAEFKRNRGYELTPFLFGLFYDIGGETSRVRCDFYEVFTSLYLKSYFRQIHDYCRKAGLLFIGHPLYEGELYPAARHQGDMFRVMEHLDWAGVDLIFFQAWSPEAEGLNNMVASKLASSAAHLYGKPRVMSESFGVFRPLYWKKNLRYLKWLTDWQAVLGVNYFLPHGMYYSVQGFRKWECPPDEFYRNPYWEYHRVYSRHVSRVCFLLSGARHQVKVGILYPIRSMWAAINPDPTKTSVAINRDFDRISELLMRLHYDFDYFPEEILQKARVENGRVKVTGPGGETREEFDLLVIPSATTLCPKTVEVLAKFAGQGGRIVFTQFLPRNSPERGEDETIRRKAKEILKKENAVYLPGTIKNAKEKTLSAVNKTLRRLLVPEVEITTGRKLAREIIYTHYEKGGVDFYFFLNTSLDRAYPVKIVINGREDSPFIFDIDDGEIKKIAGGREKREGKVVLNLTLASAESKIIAFGKKLRVRREWGRPFRILKKIKLKDEWDFTPARMNALPLNRWKVVFSQNMTGVLTAIQSKTYETGVYLDYVPDRARLLVDGVIGEKTWWESKKKPFHITVNGSELKDFRRGSYLDRYIREAAVGGLLKKGKNFVEVKTTGGLFEAVDLKAACYLIGNFSLKKQKGKDIVIPPRKKIKTGSWARQGYPYYSGTGIYEQRIDLTGIVPGERVLLRLDKVADLAEVMINGRRVKTLAWEPYETEVTGFLKPGCNTVTLKIANTLENLLCRNPVPSGLLGKVELLVGKYA